MKWKELGKLEITEEGAGVKWRWLDGVEEMTWQLHEREAKGFREKECLFIELRERERALWKGKMCALFIYYYWILYYLKRDGDEGGGEKWEERERYER